MRQVVIPLAALPDNATSMTIPDSVTAMGLGGGYGLPVESRPHHGRVFLHSQLADAIATFGIPEDRVGTYDGYQHRSFEFYAEVQVWSDAVFDFRA
jgi:hypothetical protein